MGARGGPIPPTTQTGGRRLAHLPIGGYLARAICTALPDVGVIDWAKTHVEVSE